MERNIEPQFINKDIYKNQEKKQEQEIPDSERECVDIRFTEALKKKCRPEMEKLIEGNNFIRDSLLMLFDHDEKTFLHSVEVGNIADFVMKNMGDKFTEKEIDLLKSSSLLHDIGKLALDKELLNKEKITPQDREKIKQHTLYSFELVKPYDENIAKVIVGHHEHQKNKYPRGEENENSYGEKRVPNEEIDRLSRKLSIMDSYEAIIAKRPGNPPKGIEYCDSELKKQFPLPEDQEIIFLLNQYYYDKIKNNENGEYRAVSNMTEN